MDTAKYGPCDIASYIARLRAEGELLAGAAELAGFDAPVPACPDWRVRDLLKHLGYVHRWAAGYVREQHVRWVDRASEAEILRGGPADEALAGWFRDGHAALVRALEAADPGMTCWTFLEAPSPLAFWARRQAHETAIHRADAELAAGAVTPFDPEFAADGVDELATGFAPREGLAARPQATRTLQLHAADTGDDWHLVISPGGVGARRGRREADAVLSGPAQGLYLLLWNRQDIEAASATVSGDTGVLLLWRDTMQVRWT